YYARYLDILEQARGEFFRAAGKTCKELQDLGFIFPVLDCHISYKGPARYDDLLDVQVYLIEVGRVRVSFKYSILNESGKILVTGETTHVCTSLDEKPRRLPEDLTAFCQKFVHDQLLK
ncbi:MAG: 4-hydroxybenzoyl-CoA thioesterase, partial [Verrucomicrobiales bacterium]|nr:4-hydroxybenzoyl-CoA thioesterase [Verrucomicrobiales bacterium]